MLNIFLVLSWNIYIGILCVSYCFAIYIGASLSYVIHTISEAYQVRINNDDVMGSNMYASQIFS
jgi:hypothetical protein